jgi:protein TonB
MHSYRYRPSLGNRLTALALSLAFCALIVLALIRMGWLETVGGGAAERLTAVTFRSQSSEQTHRRTVAKSARAQAPRRTIAPVTPKPKPPPEVIPPLHLLKLTPEEFAASDISKMHRQPARNSDDSDASSAGGTAYGPGEGPGGARLYNAEWYREPTHAELVTYLPHRDVAGGWAMIACRTQERYHVDDCQELGESPPGSGLARALRLAAWQFLVRPPRLDGKPLIGAWVRIRFDFTRAPAGGENEPKG